jgi:hypothetical protein
MPLPIIFKRCFSKVTIGCTGGAERGRLVGENLLLLLAYCPGPALRYKSL